MDILFFDCFAGISGDMTIGAFLDFGVKEEQLVNELLKLQIDGYKIDIKKVQKNGIESTSFNVIIDDENTNLHANDHTHAESHMHGHSHMNEDTHIHVHSHIHDDSHTHDHSHTNEGSHTHTHSHTHENNNLQGHTHSHIHRNFNDIKNLIYNSKLNKNVKELSIKIFENVAKAEAKIHGKSIDEVHFHEVGAIDSIIDIVGAAICVDILKPNKIIASPLHVGSGFVNCQHGLIPVPAPATLEILSSRNVPFYNNGIEKELVTPTGAAIITTLANDFIKMPSLAPIKVGYGAGNRDLDIPNVLRIIEGKQTEKTITNDDSNENVTVLECNIDDMTGEIFGYLIEKLVNEGALDVFYTPIYMKKNRPAYKLSLLCHPNDLQKLTSIILNETTTLGVRYHNSSRIIMERKIFNIKTTLGTVAVKAAKYNGIIKYSPEYEECKAIAVRENMPLKNVFDKVISEIEANI